MSESRCPATDIQDLRLQDNRHEKGEKAADTKNYS